ncbi:MAG: TnpV protein [Oscillospiraceae bacterium]|uniref:TnpV protein n=1 Tax=Hominenteromicrobium sp. TaxID=3073581 RepID=UPI00306EF898
MVKQMTDAEGITKALKANDQLEWVGRMNSCRDRASETVYHQVIYTVRSHR